MLQNHFLERSIEILRKISFSLKNDNSASLHMIRCSKSLLSETIWSEMLSSLRKLNNFLSSIDFLLLHSDNRMRRNEIGRYIFNFYSSFWLNVYKSSCYLIGKVRKSVYRNRNPVPIEICGWGGCGQQKYQSNFEVSKHPSRRQLFLKWGRP